MDPALGLEHEIRKAQTNEESVAAVFFYIRKASDMLWIEGLLIKLNKLGIYGKMFRWIEDFRFKNNPSKNREVCKNKYLEWNTTR